MKSLSLGVITVCVVILTATLMRSEIELRKQRQSLDQSIDSLKRRVDGHAV